MHKHIKRAMLATASAAAALAGAATPTWADNAINLDTITVWTTRTEDPVVETFAGASAVTEEQIRQIQPDDIGEMLRSVPGLEVIGTGDDPASAINIRGLQDFGRVNVMIEGARQNFQTSGHNADGVFYLDPALVEHVDITRGPVSTIFGSGAIGGIVNFRLRSASSFLYPGETWAASLSTRYDTNDDGVLTSGTAAVQPNDYVGLLGNIVWRDDGDYEDGHGDDRTNSAEEVLSGVGRVTVTPNDDHKIDFTYLYQVDEFVAGLGTTQRDTDVEDMTGTAKWTFEPADNLWIDLSVSTYITSTDTEQERLDTGAEREFEIVTVGLDASNTSRFDTGPLAHAFTYGGDFFEDQVETYDEENGGEPNAFTPTGERTVFGFFVQDQVMYEGWLEFIAALRYDEYSLSGNGEHSSGNRLSPKFTVGATVLPGVQVYGTYAEGYRAPAITETIIAGIHPGGFSFVFLPNPDLKPETAHNFEGGVNLFFDDTFREGDKIRAKFTLFHNKVSDFIEGVYSPFPAPFGEYQYQNIANVTLQGLELEGSYDAGFVFTQLSYSLVRGTDDATGEHIASVPPDKLSGTAGFRFFDETLVVGTTITHYWDQNRVPAGGFSSDDYTLFDLFATYDVNQHFSFNVAFNNVFDTYYEPYLANVPSTTAIPGPGFSFRIGGTVRFGG